MRGMVNRNAQALYLSAGYSDLYKFGRKIYEIL